MKKNDNENENTKKFFDTLEIICELNDKNKLELNNNCEMLESYIKQQGVWALFGKEKEMENADWKCLQVGQTKDIGKEIKKDITCMGYELLIEKVDYINQFAKKMFEYNEAPSARQCTYYWINKKYTDLVFVCVSKGSSLKREIEKLFAYSTEALYWRDSGTYKSEKEISDTLKNEIIKGNADKINKKNKGIVITVNELVEKLKKIM